ncbi:MAG: transcription antitermination factor NusB [Candidatus Eiseniibacteriota bacterium]|nr:MAG: transcription antitermination factor NusB [Candidatus Eisenbacteria bacterium]
MKRRAARELAFRVLYQAEIGEFALKATLEQVVADVKPSGAVADYCSVVVGKVDANRAEIDGAISGASRHWRLERMAVTDRNILRLAVAELLYVAEVPARVVIDEAIELAKKYGDEASSRFVNGILDAVAKKVRAEELSRPRAKSNKGQA